jgi:hypothetical protein
VFYRQLRDDRKDGGTHAGKLTVDGNGHELPKLVDGRWSMVDGRWSMVDGRGSMVDGRWSMVDGRWSRKYWRVGKPLVKILLSH